MHKTEKTAKESRMNLMYSHLCDTTLEPLRKGVTGFWQWAGGWRGGRSFLYRRAFRALNLELAWCCHSLFEWVRHGPTLFHDHGLE
jgi:hypothetical protein